MPIYIDENLEPSGLDDTHTPPTPHTHPTHTPHTQTCPFSSNEGLYRSLTCDYLHFSNSNTLKNSSHMFVKQKPTRVRDFKITLTLRPLKFESKIF